uniref:Uncharacterized protein n=1 Tax=Myoviridae sp. ctTrm2 TaxID=2825114 RepID=A0A8S5UK47_9CAUD|nr:MAG TPA: hypothetical protein [Myoviridae sp. ctTrm2]DAW69614.1 MAG TPA: hypothetical protein [Caudoviricetes sp.]DAY51487.1 MAG TPA: hypothetical protein [Caudoviricetes sp.]
MIGNFFHVPMYYLTNKSLFLEFSCTFFLFIQQFRYL